MRHHYVSCDACGETIPEDVSHVFVELTQEDENAGHPMGNYELCMDCASAAFKLLGIHPQVSKRASSS